MISSKSNTTRRAFFLKGGATLGAGVAAAAGAGALSSPAPAPAAVAGERDAIRSVHQVFIADVEKGRTPGAADSHLAYRSNALQRNDQFLLSEGGAQAEATWHVDVKLGTALEGDSTIAQMARLQGMLSELRWESGLLVARYEKRAGQWTLAAVRYQPT